jgi:hypothetical protein
MRGAMTPGSSLYSKKADALGRLVSAVSATVTKVALPPKTGGERVVSPQKSSISNIPVCTTDSW